METETLRPESQNVASRSDFASPEITEQTASQLKPQPTVKHSQLDPQSNPTGPMSNAKLQAAVQVRSPGSDDPTTEVEDVLESLQAPKPSSASTDPAPPLRKPHPKSRKLPVGPVRGPADKPRAAIEEPPSLDSKKPLTHPNTGHLPLPFSPCNEDGDISDDDDDFHRFYYVLFRRKSHSEMATSLSQSPSVIEQLPKPRSTRQANGRGQRRRAGENVNEIPFSDAKYQKMMGSVELPPSDIARDLAAIFGVEYKETKANNSKAPTRPNDRKRQRGRETPSASNEVPHSKRLKQTSGNSADGADRIAAMEAGRSTRYAKRNDWHMGSASADGGNQGSNKRQRTGGSNGSCAENDQKKMFEKHPDRKGWVICKRCSAPVWPPNCGKHLFHCRKP